MTEKRFTLVKCYNEQWGVVDKSLEEIDQLVLITTSKSGTGYLVNELNKLSDENEQLKSENNLFFGKVFDILLKYQDLFNCEMADEVLEELGIELTRWFE